MLTIHMFAAWVATSSFAPPTSSLACTVDLAAARAPAVRPMPRIPMRAMTRNDSLRAMYDGGKTFDEFLAAASARKEAWHANFARGATLDSAVLARARAIRGTWRLLVVAVDGCSDSVNTVPYIARLAGAMDSLGVRVVNSTVGKSVMEAHRTPDGRAATPTIVLLDAEWKEVGCFIERPPLLKQFLADTAAARASGSDSQQSRKMAWYDEDAGRNTVAQIVAMLEAAAAGRTVCE